MENRQERLLGFISKSELDILAQKTVFIPGCGAIGSYAINILARTGVGRLIVADFDSYSEQNIPGQLFCNMNTINQKKSTVAKEWVKSINPNCHIELYDESWMQPDNINAIIASADLLLLGFDTLSPGILLYRMARASKLPIVDFYYGTLLSTFVTLPGEPVPEERFNYPTLQEEWFDAEQPRVAGESLARLSAFVLSNCPWAVDDITPDVFKRFLDLGKVPVLPSLVCMAGASMADAAIEVLLDRKRHNDYKGFFFDWRRNLCVSPKDPHENLVEYQQAMAKIKFLGL